MSTSLYGRYVYLFTDEYALWVKRRMVYKDLIKMKEGQGRNTQRTLKRVKSAGIVDAVHITHREAIRGYKICQNEIQSLKKNAPVMRRRFLSDLITKAHQESDNHKVQHLKDIIRGEVQKSMWRQIQQSVGKRKAKSVMSVQVWNGATTME